MATGSVNKITLESIPGKVLKDFEQAHAARLLNSELKGRVKTWRLPDNSPYKLENGHLIKNGGAPIDKGAQESTGDPASKGQEDPA